MNVNALVSFLVISLVQTGYFSFDALRDDSIPAEGRCVQIVFV